MTATAPRSAPVEAPRGALDRAQGVELLGDVHGSGYKEGAALVRRGDGQMVQLGPLMYALLECVDGQRDASQLTACLSESTGRTFDEEHVVALADKLAAQGLLAGTEDNAPARANPLLALRWKVLVTNPQLTKRLTAPFMRLFRPWLLWPILVAFLGVCWFVLIHKGVASATQQAFHNPELLLLVFVLAIASAGFHELGHASACRYGGATPGGMGMGLYLVWPAFYTDVTDAYRLPRRDRLRTDLGGLYFNAIIAVATVGAWLVWHVDALLLLVAVQLIEMVKQLSPMIRADGYHILADATGVPDLYAHIGPTLKRLLPGHGKEPSALTGRARVIVTLWVLIVVPVLLSLAVGAILLFPRLLATGWESARHIGSAIPGQVEHGQVLGLIISLGRLLGLCLPVAGTFLMAQRLLQSLVARGRAWSDGRPLRRGVLIAAAAAATCGAAFAWWPVGQYQPVRANERGTLVSFVTAPTRAARPETQATPFQLAPGTHLAVSMVPVGGATKEHPALFVIAGTKDEPAVAILTTSSEPAPATDPATDPGTTPAATTTTDTTTTAADPSTTSTPVEGTAFSFKLPSAPRPGDSQAVAVGTKDGGVTYTVAYSLVTVKDGSAVNNTNSAFAFANCNACTTVAVSFQIVLIIGQSDTIAPVNAAGALNVNCPACITTAIADQIVVTLKSQPSDELVAKLRAALAKLDALSALGAEGSPAAIAAAVVAVQQQIDSELANSGLLANPPSTATPATTTTASTTTTTSTPTTTSSGGAAPGGSSATTTTAATSPPPTTTAEPTTTSTDPATTTAPATPPSSTTTTERTTTTSTG